MRRARPGRRINKRQEIDGEIEKDDEVAKIATDLQEYIVLSESSSPSRSSISSSPSSPTRRSRQNSVSNDSSSSSRSSHQPILRPVSNAGSGGSGKSVENENTSDKEKRKWKMDDFYRIYSFKVYNSGYLYQLHEEKWIKVYATISGENLRAVKVPDIIAVQTYEPHPTIENILSKELDPSLDILETLNEDEPIMIYSIKDSTSIVYPPDFAHDIQPLPPIPYTCFFMIGKYTFAASSYISSNSWVHAARLSSYEYALLNLYFSYSLLRVVPYIRIWSDFEILPFKTKRVKNLEWDGECKVKIDLEKEWTNYYCKIKSAVYETKSKPSETANKPSGGISKFFKGKKAQSQENLNSEEKPAEVLISPSQMMFYSSISDYKKGLKPVFMVTDVSLVYALWPKTMHQIKSDAVTDIKIMGKVTCLGEADEHRISSVSPSIYLQASNTHESLHWLVAILGAFALDADINSSDINAAVWSSPPVDWGDLSLILDEVAGLSGSVSILQSYFDYAKLLNAKKGMLRNGLFSNWQSSIKESIQTRKSYERKEVQLKASALILWLEKLRNGEVKLPNWVENELNQKIGEDDPHGEIKKLITSDSELDSDTNLIKKKKENDVISFMAAVGDEGNDDQIIVKDDGNQDTQVEGLPKLQRISSLKRKAAKKFLIGLSESLPKVFDKSEDLPSSLWYQEEESRIKEREGYDEEKEESPNGEIIPIYEANSLLDKELHTKKKFGLENFHIPEKQVAIFAENSLLDKPASTRSIQSKSDGPLLGEIKKEGNKPKLEGGLLGQMDLREKEFENFRKTGGYRATMIPPTINHPMQYPTQNPLALTEPMNRTPSNGSDQSNQVYSDSRTNFVNVNQPYPLDNRPLYFPTQVDPRYSSIGPVVDPRFSFIPHPIDPRMSYIGPIVDPRMSYINATLDPRFSFTSKPVDPKFPMAFGIGSDDVSTSAQNDMLNNGNGINPPIKLNSLASRKMSLSSRSSESSESLKSVTDHQSIQSSDDESGTESTDTESTDTEASSSHGSSPEEPKDPLLANLDDIDDTSGTSSVTSSDSDEADITNNMWPLPYPMFGPVPYAGHVFPHPMMGIPPQIPGMPPFHTLPPYLPGNMPIHSHQPMQPTKSISHSGSTTSSGVEESPITDMTKNLVHSDSGTDSDSSMSANDSKKPRSFILPGRQ